MEFWKFGVMVLRRDGDWLSGGEGRGRRCEEKK